MDELKFLKKENTATYLQNFSAILVPGGFGERGAEGKIMAAKFAREKDCHSLYLPWNANGSC